MHAGSVPHACVRRERRGFSFASLAQRRERRPHIAAASTGAAVAGSAKEVASPWHRLLTEVAAGAAGEREVASPIQRLLTVKLPPGPLMNWTCGDERLCGR